MNIALQMYDIHNWLKTWAFGIEIRPVYTRTDRRIPTDLSKDRLEVHGRLVHLRNRGIAHLTPEEMKNSVTMSELRTLVEIVSRLTATLQHLCQSQIDEYRDLAKKVIGKSVPRQRKQDDRDP